MNNKLPPATGTVTVAEFPETQSRARTADLLDVWVDDHEGMRKVGVLERFCEAGLTYQSKVAFYYLADLSDADAISLTMPIRRMPYQPKVAGLVGNLPPIFDQNIPEGALHDYLVHRYLKVIPDMGDFDLLRIAGHHSIGRIRIAPFGVELDPRRPAPPSLKDILQTSESQALLQTLFDQLSSYSGISGIQPKVLWDEASKEQLLETPKLSGSRRITINQEGYVIKAAGRDYPGLAINEYLCLKAAQMSGLKTVDVTLSDNAEILAIKRFDRDAQSGIALGFEDMTTLSALTSRDKYRGSYEEMIQRLSSMIEPARRSSILAELFKSITMSCVLGNGDAHLKNFGLLYRDPSQPAELAPVYDVCCTFAYLREDQLALSMNKSKQFPGHDALVRFGRTVCKLKPAQIRKIFDDIAIGVEFAAVELHYYCTHYPEFSVRCGQAMRSIWQSNMHYMLRMAKDYILPTSEGQIAAWHDQDHAGS